MITLEELKFDKQSKSSDISFLSSVSLDSFGAPMNFLEDNFDQDDQNNVTNVGSQDCQDGKETSSDCVTHQ